MSSPQYLATSHGTRIAYHRTEGAGPGIVFLGGFMSDMEGSKALALEAWAKTEGRAFVRFDYQGHGQSEGAFADGTIGLWAKDALAVLDTLTAGPQVLVGSSMGGWIALKLAKERPHRVRGLVGVAAAPDFTPRMWADLTAEQHKAVTEQGFVDVPTQYGDTPYRLTRALFDDGREQRVLTSPLPLDIPVRLIQGTNDPDVPWGGTLEIAEAMPGADVEIILVPGGDHRLSTERDLKRLIRITGDVAARLQG